MVENIYDSMTSREIVDLLPYQVPFLFVDEITAVDENSISGTYRYPKNSSFYQGHFKGNPITPGVILTETMAQIGLVALGIFIMGQGSEQLSDFQIALSSTEIDFYKPVYPDETVRVKSQKEYFRFHKLKCAVEMYNAKNELVCRGKIAGMLRSKTD